MGSKTPDFSGSYENSHRINAMAINFVMVGRLVLGQCQHFVMGYSRKLDATERIRRDDAVIDGLAQSDSDNGNRILYRAIAVSLGEQGWCMVRDKFVLPLLINGILWAVKLVLSKSTTAAQPEAQAEGGQQ